MTVQYTARALSPRSLQAGQGAWGSGTRRTSLRAAVVVTSVLFAVLLGAPSAQAHSDLESASPAVDGTVEEAPGALELTFTDGVQPGFAQIAVLDPSGTDVTDAEPTVQGDVVTQPVSMGGGGAYGVSYRIVSADGHTIQGTYGFTFTPAAVTADPADPTPAESTAPPSADSTPAASAPTTPSAATPAVDEAAQTGDSGGMSVATVIGLAVLAILLFISFTLARRRRLSHKA